MRDILAMFRKVVDSEKPEVTVQTWDVGSPELSLITGGLDVVDKIQSINICYLTPGPP